MAGKTEKEWEAAKAQAQKILGKEGKLPKPRVDPLASMDGANKVLSELFKLRDTLESKIVAGQDACSKVTNACKQYGDMIDGTDFELDAKNPDAKKKIGEAQKLLSSELAKIEDFAASITKILSGLDKSMASLEKDINAAQ